MLEIGIHIRKFEVAAAIFAMVGILFLFFSAFQLLQPQQESIQDIQTNLTNDTWCNLTSSSSLYPSVESQRISYNCTDYGETLRNDSPFFKYYK